MRGRRRRFVGGLAAAVAISTFLVVPGAGPAGVQLGAALPRFTG